MASPRECQDDPPNDMDISSGIDVEDEKTTQLLLESLLNVPLPQTEDSARQGPFQDPPRNAQSPTITNFPASNSDNGSEKFQSGEPGEEETPSPKPVFLTTCELPGSVQWQTTTNGTLQNSGPCLPEPHFSQQIKVEDNQIPAHLKFDDTVWLPAQLGQKQEPRLEIKAEQYWRFRYQTEVKEHNGNGRNCVDKTDAKPLVSLILHNYSGLVQIVMYCVDVFGQAHPFRLEGENCNSGVFVNNMQFKAGRPVNLYKLYIICPKMKEYKGVIEERRTRLKNFTKKSEQELFGQLYRTQFKNIDNNKMCICVEATLSQGQKNLITQSPLIQNKKKGREFCIHRVSPAHAPATGVTNDNEDKDKNLIVVTEDTFFPNRVEVVFSHEDWEEKADPSKVKVIKKAAVEFIAPPYKDIDITSPVLVSLCLRNAETGERTEPTAFQYEPVTDVYGIEKKKRKYAACGWTSGLVPEDATTPKGSPISATRTVLKATRMKHNLKEKIHHEDGQAAPTRKVINPGIQHPFAAPDTSKLDSMSAEDRGKMMHFINTFRPLTSPTPSQPSGLFRTQPVCTRSDELGIHRVNPTANSAAFAPAAPTIDQLLAQSGIKQEPGNNGQGLIELPTDHNNTTPELEVKEQVGPQGQGNERCNISHICNTPPPKNQQITVKPEQVSSCPYGGALMEEVEPSPQSSPGPLDKPLVNGEEAHVPSPFYQLPLTADQNTLQQQQPPIVVQPLFLSLTPEQQYNLLQSLQSQVGQQLLQQQQGNVGEHSQLIPQQQLNPHAGQSQQGTSQSIQPPPPVRSLYPRALQNSQFNLAGRCMSQQTSGLARPVYPSIHSTTQSMVNYQPPSLPGQPKPIADPSLSTCTPSMSLQTIGNQSVCVQKLPTQQPSGEGERPYISFPSHQEQSMLDLQPNTLSSLSMPLGGQHQIPSSIPIRNPSFTPSANSQGMFMGQMGPQRQIRPSFVQSRQDGYVNSPGNMDFSDLEADKGANKMRTTKEQMLKTPDVVLSCSNQFSFNMPADLDKDDDLEIDTVVPMSTSVQEGTDMKTSPSRTSGNNDSAIKENIVEGVLPEKEVQQKAESDAWEQNKDKEDLSCTMEKLSLNGKSSDGCGEQGPQKIINEKEKDMKKEIPKDGGEYSSGIQIKVKEHNKKVIVDSKKDKNEEGCDYGSTEDNQIEKENKFLRADGSDSGVEKIEKGPLDIDNVAKEVKKSEENFRRMIVVRETDVM